MALSCHPCNAVAFHLLQFSYKACYVRTGLALTTVCVALRSCSFAVLLVACTGQPCITLFVRALGDVTDSVNASSEQILWLQYMPCPSTGQPALPGSTLLCPVTDAASAGQDLSLLIVSQCCYPLLSTSLLAIPSMDLSRLPYRDSPDSNTMVDPPFVAHDSGAPLCSFPFPKYVLAHSGAGFQWDLPDGTWDQLSMQAEMTGPAWLTW